MNHKALSLACVVGLSSLLFTGCARTYDHNKVSTQGLRNTSVGYTNTLPNGYRTYNFDGRPNALTYDMRGTPINGTGMYSTNGFYGPTVDGYRTRTGVNSTDITGYGAYGSTGLNRAPVGTGISGLTTKGYGAAAGITGLGMTGYADSGITGITGLSNHLKTFGVDDTLVLGNTVVVHIKKGQTAKVTDIHRYVGGKTNILKVTGAKTLQVMKRVKSTLDSANASTKANRVAADVQFILKHASHM